MWNLSLIRALPGGQVIALRPATMSHHHGKRKIDTIDLTASDDDTFVGSQARKVPRQHGRTENTTQSQRDSWMDRSIEDGATEVIDLSQDFDDNTYNGYELYGKN